MFGLSCCIHGETNDLGCTLAGIVESHFRKQYRCHGAIHVIAAQRAISASRADLEHAIIESQNGDVERTPTQIIDSERTVFVAVEAVSERGGGRLVEQTQHFEASESAGVFRGLSLRIIEVSRYGDDGAAYVTQHALRVFFELFQDFRGYFHRIHDPVPHTHLDDLGVGFVFRCHESVGTEQLGFGIIGAAPHESLHTGDRVSRVGGREHYGFFAYDDLSMLAVMDDRGQPRVSITIGDTTRLTIDDIGDDGIGGAKVDANGFGSRFWVEDIDETHSNSSSKALASSRKRRT